MRGVVWVQGEGKRSNSFRHVGIQSRQANSARQERRTNTGRVDLEEALDWQSQQVHGLAAGTDHEKGESGQVF